MKKRIGSKLYDTDTALCVIPEKGLYRQASRQTYFLFDGEKITPVEYDTAAEMIKQYGGDDERAFLKRKGDKYHLTTIQISADVADHLSAYCRSHGVSQKIVIEDFISSLEI